MLEWIEIEEKPEKFLCFIKSCKCKLTASRCQQLKVCVIQDLQEFPVMSFAHFSFTIVSSTANLHMSIIAWYCFIG